MATKKKGTADAARALVAEGDVESWRRPLAQTMNEILGELRRRVRLGSGSGGLSTLELIGAAGKLGALDVEAGALLGREDDEG